MILDQNDLQNNIFVLLNIEWLFYSIVELEVDFSSDSLTESEINLYKYSLRKFAKLVHKEIKITTYTVNSYSKRNYDPIQKSLFSQGNNHIFEDDHSSDVFSSSMTSNNLNYNISFNPKISIIVAVHNCENYLKKPARCQSRNALPKCRIIRPRTGGNCHFCSSPRLFGFLRKWGGEIPLFVTSPSHQTG